MLIVYKNLQKYKLYQTNKGLCMNKSVKFKQFLADIKQANPSLVESVIEAYHAVYESTEEIVDRTKKELDDLGGSVPSAELTGLQKLPLRKEAPKPQADDLYAQYMNFKRYGNDKIPMRKAERSPMIDFIEYELDDKDLADALELVLRKSANDRPSILKEIKTAFDNFINERIDIDEFSDLVEQAYNQLESVSEDDTADYKQSLDSDDTLDTVGGVLDTTKASDGNWW